MVMAAPNSIFESAHKGDFDAVKASVDEDNTLIRKKDDNQRVLLHWAALSGNLKLVMYLIELGSEIDAIEETDATPLILASSAGRTEIVEVLLKNKADVDHQTTQGHSSLQYAASKGWAEICMKLIASGANINIADTRGATPLHRAASKGNLEVVKFLISFTDKINVNAKDYYGNTPLHLACEEDRHDEAMMLLDHGGQVDALNKEQKTPLDLCSRGLHKILTTKAASHKE